MGRLIPAGTGVRLYQDLTIELADGKHGDDRKTGSGIGHEGYSGTTSA